MSKRDRSAAYDRFARVYSRHWAQEVPPQLMAAVERLLVPRLRAGARLLDLCCGTGYTVRELLARGFAVTGLDISKEMLREARRASPRAHLIQADARRFQLSPVYDGVLSTFDSLNHIMTKEELAAVFRNVYGALVPGGLFLFDMNMEEAFLEHWADYYAIVEETEVCVLRGAYDQQQGVARYDITMFHRDADGWQRTDTSILEKYYPAKKIRRALKEAGFKKVSAYDAEHDLGFKDHIGRTFFLAQKPHASRME